MKHLNEQILKNFYTTEGEKGQFEGRISNVMQHLLTSNVKNTKSFRHLDVGCAEGYCSDYVTHAMPHAFSVGVEMSRPKLLRAKKHSKGEFVNATWDNLPFRADFDLITFVDTIEHTINPDSVLSQIKQCLKENGCLILGCPSSTRVMMIPEMLEICINKLAFRFMKRIFRGHLHWFLIPHIQKVASHHLRIVKCYTTVPLSMPVWKQIKCLITGIVQKTGWKALKISKVELMNGVFLILEKN